MVRGDSWPTNQSQNGMAHAVIHMYAVGVMVMHGTNQSQNGMAQAIIPFHCRARSSMAPSMGE